MIDTSGIDNKFDSDVWQDVAQLTGKETNEELIAKINELSDHVNYLFRFLIGAPE